MDTTPRKTLFWTACALAAGTAIVLWATTRDAGAADLGGNCCTDLEERIAELEATTARKGNRKVTLTVYGQINKALLHVSGDIDSNTFVIENSNEESFVGFAGSARISPDVTAGYVLELGIGEQADIGAPNDANGIYTRHSFVYLDSKSLGKASLGLADQATKGITQRTEANTGVAAKMLSLRPITGAQVGEAADIFEGGRANLVRYDSPTFVGAVLSASWSTGDSTWPADGSDLWDVALRWSGEGNGFRASAGIGYRHGIAVPTVISIGGTAAGGIDTWAGSASVMHIDSGLFAAGAYGHLDFGAGTVQAYHVQAGWEKKWLTGLGKTTVYGEFADANDLDLNIWGGGVVQAIDAAAMDLYLSGRRIEQGGGAADLIMAGARIQF